MDEALIHRIGALARTLGTSKKAVIEEALRSYAVRVEREGKADVFEATSGAWRRKGSPVKTVDAARAAFRRSMERRRR